MRDGRAETFPTVDKAGDEVQSDVNGVTQSLSSRG